MKADLFATAVNTESGFFLVDPFAAATDELADSIGEANVAAIVVTNANHVRSAVELAKNYKAPVFAHRATGIADEALTVNEVTDGTQLSEDVRAIGIEGAAAGEIALHCANEGGTMILGDAVINFGTHGFSFLPGKYCSNSKLMRKSLRKLLDYSFERILFAHGMPILRHGRDRLANLLEGG